MTGIIKPVLSTILYQVLILLVASVVIGELFRHLGFSSVAGELLSGIIVGPSVLGLVTSPQDLSALAFVALFFIIYQLGFTARTEKLKKHVIRGTTVAITSFIAPFIIVLGISYLVLDYGPIEDFILALAVSVPSISVVSVLVRDTGMEALEGGQIIMAGVVIVDVLAFILLAAVTRTIEDTLRIVLFTVVFIAAFLLIDHLLNMNLVRTRRFFRKISKAVKGEEIAYASLIVTGLVVSELFQIIGLVYVLGAFFAALIVHEEVIGVKLFEKVSNTVNSMNKAFFAPFFFGYAGSEVIISQNGQMSIILIVLMALLLVLLSVAFTFYATRGFFPGRDGERKGLSYIMAGKGSVGIIIGNVALDAGLIAYQVNSLIIIATIVGSLTVTLLLRGGVKGNASMDL